MARFSNEIQQHEVEAYEKFCLAHNVILDSSDIEASTENANLVREYFLKTWNEVVTEQNLERALPHLRPHLKFKSVARLEYEKVANQEPDRANQLAAWLQTQGSKPGQLVNTGDEAFDNLRLLLLTLQGYEISPARIRDAEDRIAHKPGKKLQYVPEPRREGPRSEAAKADDGVPFLGRNLNEPEWVRRSRERSEREAAEAVSNQRSSASAQSAAVRDAKEKAESIAGSTHSETDQLRKIFVSSGTEIDWVQTLASRQRMQVEFDKQRAVRRFIR